MIRAAILGLAFCLASPAFATVDGWPALYDVVGVASDDSLNVRTKPDVNSEVIGVLRYDSKDVEVIRTSEDELWGLVNFNGVAGWSSLRFLKRHPGQFDGHFPDFTTCGGTEPFWSLERNDGYLALDISFDDTGALSEPIHWETGTVNHRYRYSFRSESMAGVIHREMCSDGMSDQEFGLELNLILLDRGLQFQGCCSLQPGGGSR